MRPALFAALSSILLLIGCQSNEDLPPARGEVRPTVAGGAPTTYAALDEARRAFTRTSGSLTATLQDASWLRLLGPADQVEQQHRAYFEYGYTTFDVELRAEEFTQPVNETFILEDSQGARLSGKPLRYDGSEVYVDRRFLTRFELAFQHAITADTRWIRLIRQADGSSVEWAFP